MPEKLRRLVILALVVWSLAWAVVSLEQTYASLISPDRRTAGELSELPPEPPEKTRKEPSKTTTENPETTRTTTTKPQPTPTIAGVSIVASASSIAAMSNVTETSTSLTTIAGTFDWLIIAIVVVAVGGGGALSVAKFRTVKKSKVTKFSKLKEPATVGQSEAAPKINIQPGHEPAGPSIGPGQGPSIGPGAETGIAPPRLGPVIPTLVPRSARTCAHCGHEIANIDLYCPSCGIKLSAEQ